MKLFVSQTDDIVRKDFLLGSVAILFIVVFVQLLSILNRQGENTLPADSAVNGADAVELVVYGEEKGIYFVSNNETVSGFLSKHVHQNNTENKTGIKQGTLIHYSGDKDIIVESMKPHKKLALGIPLDPNDLSSEELMLIPGIGEKTAVKIYQFIKERGGIRSLTELAEIPGIKNHKIEKYKRYFKISIGGHVSNTCPLRAYYPVAQTAC